MVTDTSLMAYRELIKSGKLMSERSKILFWLEHQGGLTSAELAKMSSLARHNAASRLSELLKDGTVTRQHKRECSICHRVCYEWQIAQADE